MIDIFAISKTICVTQLNNGGILSKNPDVPKYYLKNIDLVNESGKIVKEGTEEEYTFKFRSKIKKIKSFDIDDFLDVHFQASANKKRFIKILEALSVGDLFKDDHAKNHFVREWLKLNKGDVTNQPGSNTTSEAPQAAYLLLDKTGAAKQKGKPAPPQKLIIFDSMETIDRVFDALKIHFAGFETEFKDALEGKQLATRLIFPNNQNKFTEVFRRLKYNGFITSIPKEIQEWLCINFQFNKKGIVTSFKKSTVLSLLTKARGEPAKNERICLLDWLPYKSSSLLKKEANEEQD